MRYLVGLFVGRASTRGVWGTEHPKERAGLFQFFDFAWPKPTPVLAVGHDDRGLQVAERQHVLASFVIDADVDLLVSDARLVQRLVGGVALRAVGLRVDGDYFRASRLSIRRSMRAISVRFASRSSFRASPIRPTSFLTPRMSSASSS